MSFAVIQAWMQEVVGAGIPVIAANQNAPRPAAPYITVKHLTGAGTCYPSVERTKDVDGDVVFAVQTHREETYSVNAFGTTSRELLMQLSDAASLPSSAERPVLIDCGDIRDLSFLDDSHWANRHHVDMVFAESSYLERTDAAVDTVEVTGDVGDLESSVTMEF